MSDWPRLYIGGGVTVDALTYYGASDTERKRLVSAAQTLAVKAQPKLVSREILEHYND